MTTFHCGFVALIGRPNVGKSTLLNALLGKKISIVSRKPQTTRQRILGVATEENYQAIYVDTPGIHIKTPHALNKYMNKVAIHALREVDVVLFLTEALRWTEEDEYVLKSLGKIKTPVIWVVNKVDQVKNKEELLPYLEKVTKQFSFAQVLPICARRIKDIARVSQTVKEYLPDSPELLYSENQITDRDESFIAAEYIRESLLNLLGDEVPHQLTTVVEKIEHKPKIIVIHAVIYVERESHKAIIIGKSGERLRAVGQEARMALEHYFNKKVFLELWVKVKEGWIDDTKAMRQLGFKED